ncbi:hypothetical protein AB6A40_008847 [Gnathostoma spinigerum]|uniref:Uncharacterized protein n=1 Tax=Gnathostoma spinigerum TaxID=75299 RepID=A0ABD6EYI4_9BILA
MRPGGILVSNVADWTANKTLFFHWLNRYTNYLLEHTRDPIMLDENCLNAIAFWMSQPCFVTAVEKRHNSQLIVGHQLRILKGLSRYQITAGSASCYFYCD